MRSAWCKRRPATTRRSRKSTCSLAAHQATCRKTKRIAAANSRMPDLHDHDGAHVKSIIKVTAIVALVAIALVAGFWLGRTGSTPLAAPSSEASSPEPKILYYRNPMGLPDISAVPKKDPMGMDYIPVYAGEEQSASNTAVKINPEKNTEAWG